MYPQVVFCFRISDRLAGRSNAASLVLPSRVWAPCSRRGVQNRRVRRVEANIIKRKSSIGILVPDEVEGEHFEDDSSQKEDVLTLFSLLKSMMKPKTLPHVGFMIVSSALLFTFFSGNQHIQAVIFIGLSFAYLLLGVFLGEKFENILGVKSKEQQSIVKKILFPLLPPVGLSVLLILTMLVTLDFEEDKVNATSRELNRKIKKKNSAFSRMQRSSGRTSLIDRRKNKK